MSVNLPPEPVFLPREHTHDDGRRCEYRPYFVGNPRDGHWEMAYWYVGEFDTWRYCERDH